MKITSLVLMVLFASASWGQLPMSAAQKEVWAGEEAYCRYLMAGDMQAYMSLWDEKFIGWPYGQHVPANKDVIRKSVESRSSGPQRKFTCESEPKAVNVFGDIGITFYLFHSTTTVDGKSTATVARITHTWRRTNGKWHIIGGMSAPQQKKQD